MSSSSAFTSHNFATFTQKTDPLLPSMIVFDLDDCLWSPEMHELPGKPSIPIQGNLDPTGGGGSQENRIKGVCGLQVPRGPTVHLFDGARHALFELATNPRCGGIILAVASSSLEPSFSYACLEHIEILPGLSMRNMFRYDQIGRTGQLSPRKTSHFRLLQKESNVPCEEMLFFDDCNWGDHCADVTNNFGVVSQRTPSGMRMKEFRKGLELYRKVAATRVDKL